MHACPTSLARPAVPRIALTHKYRKLTAQAVITPTHANMSSSWTHLVRFVAIEDNQVHLGQLVDTGRDVGKDSANGVEIPVKLINGSIYNGRVTDVVMHVKSVSSLR